MKKVLITGGAGFAAGQLINDLLIHGDHEIHTTKRVRTDMYRPERLGFIDKVEWHLIELTDAHSVHNVIKEVMPDQIYHLAAQDYVKSSWESPHETFYTNVNGTINLFEAVRRLYQQNRITTETHEHKHISTGISEYEFPYPKILITSTSETYGEHFEEIHETSRQTPNNPYGISKLAQDLLSRLYSRAYKIPCVVTRSFNVTGWGRNDPFVDSDFAKQIVEIEKDKRKILQHGNLESKRSFFDVKDAVRGYYLAMNSEYQNGDVFCFGPEKSTSIGELLKILCSLSTTEIKRTTDPNRFRPVDTSDMRVDSKKAQCLLKWEPKVPLKQSLEDLLNYWRERL